MRSLPSGSRVLLTGGAGFLGSHCLELLRKLDVELHVASRTKRGRDQQGTIWHAADLTKSATAYELVCDIRPTHILHNAWMAVPGRFWSDPENLEWLHAGQALAAAFRKCGGLRFVGTGTCAEYDWKAEHFEEDVTPIRPNTLYGKSKAAMRASVAAHAHDVFSYAWARVFLPYGPGDNEKRLIPSVINSLQQGNSIALGADHNVRDFIWAPDVADLLVHLLCGREDGIFNAGTGRGTSIREVAEWIGSRLQRTDLLQFGSRQNVIEEPKRLVADMKKCNNVLNWRSKTDLFSGLNTLLEGE